MKSFTTLLVLLFSFFTHYLSAQKKSRTLSVLWKIESPKTRYTSYLLGTYHLFSNEWLTTHPKVDSLLALSNVYMCEVIPLNQDAPKQTINHVKAKELFGKDYDKVNHYFIKKTGEGLTENIDKDNDPAEMLRGMIYFLSQDIAAQKGLKISQGYELDNILLEQAIKQNKQTIQLDNDKVLRSVITGNSITNDKIKLIVNMVDIISDSASIKKVPQLTELSLYEKGKYTFNFTDADQSGEKSSKAITRNNFWMKKIPAYLNKGKVFIAVGAGHLNGKDGLIMQLKNWGYTISPVNF